MFSKCNIRVDGCLRAVLLGFGGGVALLVAGCVSQPGYHPAGSPGGFGYRNSALSGDHYRIAYAGSYGLPRSVVAKFALYRAAEVTLAHGAERFRVVSRQTSPITTTESLPSARVGFGVGWGSPYFGTGFGFPISVSSDTRYESVLIIRIGSEVPEDGPRVYNAEDVKRHLENVIVSSGDADDTGGDGE